jgi:CMP-N,N'-diacetyllegionaminic acid synthase
VIPCVIPARGGSKRIPHKNIHPLGGRPLLSYTIEAALTAALGPCLVSTDDEDIGRVASANGARVIERPRALSGDEVSTELVVLHVLDLLQLEGVCTEWVMILPPTSPFRGADLIRRVADCVKENDVDCIMTVTETRADFWRGNDLGRLCRLFPDAPRRQQDRTPLYEENSAVYLSRVSALRKTRSVLGGRVRGIPISPLEALDVNTSWDLTLAETLISAGVAFRKQ